MVPNRDSPPAVLLRETERVGKKTVKRTLANLSALPPEAVAALRIILKGGRVVEATDHFAVERSLPCRHVRAVRMKAKQPCASPAKQNLTLTRAACSNCSPRTPLGGQTLCPVAGTPKTKR